MIAADASLVLGWVFLDERTDAIAAAVDRISREGAVVPMLWRLEIANVLRTRVRKGKTTLLERDEILRAMADLVTEVDTEMEARSWTDILALSDKHGLTIYDATYLEVALRRQIPLATLDQELITAGHAEGLEVLP